MPRHWDKPVRGERYSIVTKRRLLRQFRADPNEMALKRLARSMWAFDIWSTVEFPVEERLLGNGHTPTEFRDFLVDAHAGERSTGDPDTPDIGPRVLSELLEAMDPQTYATINGESREGMDALGYPTPGRPIDDEEYWQFVDDVAEAVERFALRSRLTDDILPAIPDDIPTVDVAQVAFHAHGDDRFDFDLSTVATRA